MRKIISIVMIMFMTLGVVPADATPKANEELKTKIEENIKTGALYNSVVRPVANYYKIGRDDFFQYGAKFRDLVNTLSGDSDNVLIKFVEGNVVILPVGSTLDGTVTGKSYKPIVTNRVLSELQLVGDFVDSETVDTRLTYGILRIKSLGDEVVNYTGSFYGGNNKGDFSSKTVIEPNMTLIFESGKHFDLDDVEKEFTIPCSVKTNLNSVTLDVKISEFTNEFGQPIDIPVELRGDGVYTWDSSAYGKYITAEKLLRIVVDRPEKLTALEIKNNVHSNNMNLLPVGDLNFSYDITMSPGTIK